MRTKLMALEAIHYQDTKDFFKELTEVIVEIRTDIKALGSLNNIAFYRHEKIQAISKCIKKYTNIPIELNGEFSNQGPLVTLPQIAKNHIFWSMTPDSEEWNTNGVMQYFNKMKEKSKTFIGEVNIRTAQVSGAFSTMPMEMGLPAHMLLGVGVWKSVNIAPDEVAGSILHEVGHVFTYYEFLTRIVNNNQVLSAIARANIDNDVESKKYIISKSEKDLKLAPDDVQALLKTTDNNEVSVILVQAAKAASISELGLSIYDAVSCEQLADQFANRMGAGKAVVIGLDKIHALYGIGRSTSLVAKLLISIISAILLISSPALFITCAFYCIVIYLVTSISNSFATDIYDEPHTRFLRIKHDLVNRLKDPRINDQERDSTLEDIKSIDTIIEKTPKEVLSFSSKIAYYFSSTKKSIYNSTMLQKELEVFANNNLFVHAAKLKSALGQ